MKNCPYCDEELTEDGERSTCSFCQGTGLVEEICPTCQGTGSFPIGSKHICERCKGKGEC